MLEVFETYESLCAKVAREIRATVSLKPEALLCIAAGHTSLGVFKELIEARAEGQIDFSRAAFVSMDEWLGMSRKTAGSCGDFLDREFLDHVNFSPENIRLFNGEAGDPEAECASVEDFIRLHGGAIDYLVLGAGMNGHLALNEPGTPWNRRAHATKLDPVTTKVGQKYFQEETALAGGLTLGVADFSEAGRGVLLVSGAHKVDILKKILGGAVSDEIPATAVRGFANASIYADRAAADPGADMSGAV